MHFPGDADADPAADGQQPDAALTPGAAAGGLRPADAAVSDRPLSGDGRAGTGQPGGAPSAAPSYGTAGGTAAKGPVRGFPPPPGQARPVYPPGQFSAWNQAAADTRQRRPGSAAVTDAWPVAASAEHGFAEPDYSVLAVSDPAADATITQTWAVVDDRATAGWRDLNASYGTTAVAAERPRAQAPRGHPAGQPAPAAEPPALDQPVRLPDQPAQRPDQAAQSSDQPAQSSDQPARRGRRSARAATGPGTDQRQAQPAAGAAGGAAGGPGRRSSRGTRRRRPTAAKRGRVLLAIGLAVVVAVGPGTYFYLNSGHQPAGQLAAGTTTTPSSRPKPSPSPTGRWGHIQTRAADPRPLTIAELFPASFTSAGSGYARTAARAGKHCSAAVLGSRLQSAVAAAGCDQVLRASYLSGNGRVMGTIGVLNTRTARTASRAGNATGPSQFIAQLPGAKGPTRNLTKGTGIEEAQVKGHYLILIWAEFASLRAPRTSHQRNELVQFCTRLLRSTANVSLSRRLLTGQP